MPYIRIAKIPEHPIASLSTYGKYDDRINNPISIHGMLCRCKYLKNNEQTIPARAPTNKLAKKNMKNFPHPPRIAYPIYNSPSCISSYICSAVFDRAIAAASLSVDSPNTIVNIASLTLSALKIEIVATGSTALMKNPNYRLCKYSK